MAGLAQASDGSSFEPGESAMMLEAAWSFVRAKNDHSSSNWLQPEGAFAARAASGSSEATMSALRVPITLAQHAELGSRRAGHAVNWQA